MHRAPLRSLIRQGNRRPAQPKGYQMHLASLLSYMSDAVRSQRGHQQCCLSVPACTLLPVCLCRLRVAAAMLETSHPVMVDIGKTSTVQ